MKLVILLLIASSAMFAQAITSVTCWGKGGRTCYDYITYPIPDDSKSCKCAAVCKGTTNISAGYSVWWDDAPNNGTGGVNGGALSFSVRVNGSVTLYCNPQTPGGIPYTAKGQGFDDQDCNGAITKEPPSGVFSSTVEDVDMRSVP